MIIICPQCGDAFTERRDYQAHYLARHPDEPYPELWDSPDQDEEFRSWGGTDPTDSDQPINIFEDAMEESPEETLGADRDRTERQGEAA